MREMFARIAPRYDVANRVLTAGMDERWRRRAIALLAPPRDGRDPRSVLRHRRPGLSSACAPIRALHVTGIDFCAPMLDGARARAPREARGDATFVEGDVMALPFARWNLRRRDDGL